MKKIVFFLLLVSVSLNAQDFKFGKVSVEDFNSLTEDDKNAEAVVLYRSVEIDFPYSNNEGYTKNTEVHERILINSEDGLRWATQMERLYNRNNSTEEQLIGLRGYTYKSVNGEVKEVKLRKDGVFEDEINEYWKVKKFTMPDVQVGSIIEFKYTITSPFVTVDDIDLQYTIPIKKEKIKMILPPYYIYNVSFNPRAAYIPSFAEDNTKDNGKIQELKRVLVEVEDVPALENEPMSGSLDNFRSKVIIELAGKNFPGKALDLYSTSWENVAKTISDSKNFGDQLEKTKFFKEDLEAVLSSNISPLDRVEAIFEHVKSKVKWNDYYGVYAQKGIKDAYKEGSGNVADVNLLLTAMLSDAGLEAFPVLVSTKNNGIPFYPTREGFNYVIALVMIDGKIILLDATEEKSTLNVLPSRVLNWQGRALINDGTSYWVDLNPKINSKETTLLQVSLTEDGLVEGKVRKRLTDYEAYRYRSRLDLSDTSKLMEYLEEDELGLTVEDAIVKNADNLSKPLDISYDFEQEDASEEIGGSLYISPLLFEATTVNPFKSEKRTLPIDLVRPVSQKIIVNMKVPEGFTVVSLPESIKVNYGNGYADYMYVIKLNGNIITISSDFNLNVNLVMPNDYQFWKDFYGKIVEKESEKIVLKKI
ncbi:MAG: DUF3857 domain-containing protein [Nonlabens sp.]|uniref:DUF3857 domain-containing protein n=1 Tax=Nonlabens sp. TaxID=1888209 RepID=UPI003EF2CD6B